MIFVFLLDFFLVCVIFVAADVLFILCIPLLSAWICCSWFYEIIQFIVLLKWYLFCLQAEAVCCFHHVNVEVKHLCSFYIKLPVLY